MSYIELYGLIRSTSFHHGLSIVKNLQSSSRSHTEGFFEADWEQFQLKKCNKFDPSLEVLCYINNLLIDGIGELSQIALEKYKYIENTSPSIFAAEAERAYLQKLSNPSKKYVLWHIKIANNQEKPLVIELDLQKCPKTSENFWQLSNTNNTLYYEGSTIHRIVSNGYIEGGFISTASGKSHFSIYGNFFEDENYSYLHDKPGVIGMSKYGRNENGSLFYITLRPFPSLDGKMVAFGRVVEGMDVVRLIGNAPVINQKPSDMIVITKSQGYIEFLTEIYRNDRSGLDEVKEKGFGNEEDEDLVLRRDAIVQEIENERHESGQQKILRTMIADIIEGLTEQSDN
jgi:cyclophilin family peptidyl-prolyl cis-trans isomerase